MSTIVATSHRKRKGRNGWWFLKVLFVLAVSLATLGYFSMPTNSLFTDEVELSMGFGTEWNVYVPPPGGGGDDEDPPPVEEEYSDLTGSTAEFIHAKDEELKMKKLVTLHAKNSGATMKEAVTFELIRTHGHESDPENGEIIEVDDNEIRALASGESVSITAVVKKGGDYFFKIFPEPGSPGEPYFYVKAAKENCGHGEDDGGDHEDGDDHESNILEIKHADLEKKKDSYRIFVQIKNPLKETIPGVAYRVLKGEEEILFGTSDDLKHGGNNRIYETVTEAGTYVFEIENIDGTMLRSPDIVVSIDDDHGYHDEDDGEPAPEALLTLEPVEVSTESADEKVLATLSTVVKNSSGTEQAISYAVYRSDNAHSHEAKETVYQTSEPVVLGVDEELPISFAASTPGFYVFEMVVENEEEDKPSYKTEAVEVIAAAPGEDGLINDIQVPVGEAAPSQGGQTDTGNQETVHDNNDDSDSEADVQPDPVEPVTQEEANPLPSTNETTDENTENQEEASSIEEPDQQDSADEPDSLADPSAVTVPEDEEQ
ncbi:hypothetical protein [Bacillus marinisedimentorum]|uniref:hypothetical protein n=1 Tax=Bacillus marinisedimentorum TaxID=1821260 RepID=UPI0007E29555|nr:hypothetical protein [Bacillus marinisedimentorum]